ncbi:OPT oligopeptide transporter protein-domain-containing protein [Lipomyces kononenkoae]|uniref:OPT oligopeptide transporter protein-domain-containing protein n=1 Tax=Lipomyces kononenkoae TaxID=34357 RepID=A0ACC3SZK0_LIPKO
MKETPDFVTGAITDSSSMQVEKEKQALVSVQEVGDISNFREKVLDRLQGGMRKDLEDILNVDSQMNYLLDMMDTLTVNEGLHILEEAAKYHEDDPNFPTETLRDIQLMLKGKEAYGTDHETYIIDVLLEATLIKYHSPYPEVRAICDPTDDPTLPVETIRAYFLGIIWVAIGSFINELFTFRQPSLKLRSTSLQLLLYPCGKLLERILPDKGITLFGVRHSLNPGPWNFKEQMLATLMVNVGSGSTNFMSYVMTMKLKLFFNQSWISFGFIFLLNFSTQFMGFGLAGILRRWVVFPTKAVWPSLLPTLMLNRTLLLPETGRAAHGWTITKYKFFFICLGVSFLYFFIPGYVFTGLSTFNWMTWIAPHNKVLAIVTGSSLGLGFNPWTSWDWAVINYSNPLATPFFSAFNRYIGMVFAGLLILALYWKNYKWTGYLPINSNATWNNVGTAFNASKIVNDKLELDLEKYRAYSPPFISLGYVVFYGAEFALFTMSFIYIGLSEWPQVKAAAVGFWRSLKDRKRSNYEMEDDPISKMMAKYPEVPDWWYIFILLLSLAFGIVAVQCWPTNTPSWSIIVIIVVCVILVIPSAVIMSVTGYQLGFNDIGIILAGYMVPGRAIANMICRVYGWNVDAEAESFIGDQKLAHYSKIPPRAMFRCQMIATLIQTFCTIGALDVLIKSIPDVCSPTQPDKFVCTFPRALYTATLVWGVVGPARVFNSIYPMLKWAFLIGFLAAAPIYYTRRYFHKYLKHFNPILFLSGMTRYESAYNLSYYTPGIEIGFIFMYYVRRRYLSWWTKYNYVLTSALGAGVAFGGIVIFATLQSTQTTFKWWGNTISSSGVDGARTAALYALPPGTHFGPETWE